MEAISRLTVEAAEAPDTDADEALALRARIDREAFAELYARHRVAVFRYLRARCRDEDLALELTAVTFEKALGAIGRYRTRGGGVLAWLLRIARNTATTTTVVSGPSSPNGRWTRTIAVPIRRRRRPSSFETSADAFRRLLADLPDVQRDAGRLATLISAVGCDSRCIGPTDALFVRFSRGPDGAIRGSRTRRQR